MRLPSSLTSYGYPVKRCAVALLPAPVVAQPATPTSAARIKEDLIAHLHLSDVRTARLFTKKSPVAPCDGALPSRLTMAVGSARGAVIGAAHALVAEGAGGALRAGRAQRMTGGVNAAERGAAVGVPQALRAHRRRIGAGARDAGLTERAVGRG